MKQVISAIRNVMQLLRLLELYDNRFDKKLFSEIDIKFVKGFDIFLQKRGCRGNTRKYYFKALRSILNKAIQEKEATEKTYPFGKGGFHIARLEEETEKRYLTIEDLNKIKNTPSRKPQQEYARQEEHDYGTTDNKNKYNTTESRNEINKQEVKIEVESPNAFIEVEDPIKDRIYEDIFALPEVKEITCDKGSVIEIFDPSEESVYTVAVRCYGGNDEDGYSSFTFFWFYVYTQPEYEIKYHNLAGDTVITLDEWRKSRQ